MTKEEVIKFNVCEGCGGKLTIKTIKKNSCFTEHKEVLRDEVVCEHCSKITWGIVPKDFEIANKLVREFGYLPYSQMDKFEYQERDKKNPEMEWMEYFYESQVSGAYDLIRWLRKNNYLNTHA